MSKLFSLHPYRHLLKNSRRFNTISISFTRLQESILIKNYRNFILNQMKPPTNIYLKVQRFHSSKYLTETKEKEISNKQVNPNLDHKPVLLNEVLEKLNVKAGGIYIDATFGYGGYTKTILDANPTSVVFALDQDPHAYLRAHKMAQLESYKGRLVPLLGKFGNISRHLEEFRERLKTEGSVYLDRSVNFDKFDGLVMDIGVSSGQLDDPARGFSFLKEGPLDMRMCNLDASTIDSLPLEFSNLPEVDWELQKVLYASRAISAYDIVNHFSVEQITEIILKFGEERFSKAIAQAIDAARQNTSIETTTQLSDIILSVCPRHIRPKYFQGRLSHTVTHPATRTFQSLRIYVNDELGELSRLLDSCPSILKSGSNLVAVTFHSLEDRIVKRFLFETSNPERQQGEEHIFVKSYDEAYKKDNQDQIKKFRRLRYHQKMAEFDKEPEEIVDTKDFQLNYSFINDPVHEDSKVDNSIFRLPKPRSKGLIFPSDNEIKSNPRSRSAKLRWATRV